MFVIFLPYINPVLTEVGPLVIRWYSLAYIFGIFIGMMYFKYLAKKVKFKLTRDFIDDYITAIVLGIVIGGRLGFVLIYDPNYYLAHPLEILKTWQGGMSFHGGFMGFCVANLIIARMYKITSFTLLDITACCAPIGIFLGRIANFINGELYGRVSSLPWAVVFPNQPDIARHPSQLYEAFTEGLLLFVILNIATLRLNYYKKPGLISGLFCVFYSLFRWVAELFREPDAHIGFLFNFFTMGQLLSSAMLMLGLVIIYRSTHNNKLKN